MDIFEEKNPNLEAVNEINEVDVGRTVYYIGRVEDPPYLGVSKTKAKSRYLRLTVADETGYIKTMIFNDKLDTCKRINDGLPKEKSIVMIKGRKVEEAVFADYIVTQTNKIYTKLADLKG